MKHKIIGIEKGGIAEEMGVSKGDYLLFIDGREVNDVFDYRLYLASEYIEVTIEKANKEVWLLEIDKDIREDLGLIFENDLMDEEKSCKNACIFCFIDQLPTGMRDTLYFKDDDTRLSFLDGNYVTLTNMSEEEIDRMIVHRLSPINISVHATDDDTRLQMVRNKKTIGLMDRIKKIDEAGIRLNFQLVLVKNINDAKILEASVSDLLAFENAESLSVVPVGLTKFRKGLYPIEPFTKEDAISIIDCVESFQKKAMKQKGNSFCYPADEFFYLAEKEIPPITYYDDFLQIENGVGMSALFQHEVLEAVETLSDAEATHIKNHTKTLITGKLFYKELQNLIDMINKKTKGTLEVIGVENLYFGSNITVSGLLTGHDLIHGVKECRGEEILLPINMVRYNSTLLLDDWTTEKLEAHWKKPVTLVQNDGSALIQALLD